MINLFVQGVLMLLIIYRFFENSRKMEVMMIMLGLLFINPIVTALNMQNVTIFYILLFTLLFLGFRRNLSDFLMTDGCFYMFLFVGIAVAYFDFLTYPLVALAIPLLLLTTCTENIKISEVVKRIIIMSISFTIGYLGMWFMKWVIATWVTGQNIFADAWNSAKYRLAMGDVSEGEVITFWDALFKNLKDFVKWPFVIMFAIVVIFLVIQVIKRKNMNVKECIRYAAPYVLVGMFPLGHMLAANHAYMHGMFTHREFAITIVAAFLYGVNLINMGEKSI